MNKLYFAVILLLFVACNNNQQDEVSDNSHPPPPLINYNVVNVYPHDTSSFTEGLIWYDNSLYESTGSVRKIYPTEEKSGSRIMKVNIEDGKLIKQITIDTSEFGEGITILNDTLYQLTWTSNKVHVYDAKTLKKIKDFIWNYQGWGITHNGSQLIISTGTSNLYFVDPQNFKILKIVGVTDNYGPAGNLNELEYINGYLYANQWQTNYILKINPETGVIEGKLDLTGVLQKSGNNTEPEHYDVLNGIAYDSAKKSLYVTGKLWPALFEIKLNQ